MTGDFGRIMLPPCGMTAGAGGIENQFTRVVTRRGGERAAAVYQLPAEISEPRDGQKREAVDHP